jgi:hypothetical protein
MHTSCAEGPEKLSRISLGLFRMVFGLLWLDMAFQKAPWIIQDGHRFGWLHGWIQNEIAHPTFGLYQWFLQGVVLSHFTLFGFLTFLTETALGLSLLLGLFTVLGGIGGALWQVNIALGSFSVPGEWYWTWFLLIAPQLVFAATRSGRTLGIDGWLLARLSLSDKERAGFGGLLARLV